MGTIRISEAGALPWVSARDHSTPEEAARFGGGELQCDVIWHQTGDVTAPELMEIRFPPNTGPDQHAHDQDELIYILDGELRVGARVLGPGSTVLIGGHTLYSFRAGPEGVRFLNFRPTAGSRYIFKDEFLQTRGAGSGSAATIPDPGAETIPTDPPLPN